VERPDFVSHSCPLQTTSPMVLCVAASADQSNEPEETFLPDDTTAVPPNGSVERRSAFDAALRFTLSCTPDGPALPPRF